jgi:hypothetical protein
MRSRGILLALVLLPAGLAAADAPERLTRAVIEDQFRRHDPDYDRKRQHYKHHFEALHERMLEVQAAGRSVECTNQLLLEARWLMTSTTRWDDIERLAWLIEATLGAENQHVALTQSAYSGSWGVCYSEWFLKLDASLDALNKLSGEAAAPNFPLYFLDRIGTPEQMTALLDELRVSDIARHGVDGRAEFGATTTFISRLVLKPQMLDYIQRHAEHFRPDADYVSAFETWLDAWQDPETGFWGTWYRIGDEIVKAPDLSFTYHIAVYRGGRINHWDRLLETLLAIRDAEYPYGWRVRGEHHNHNSYDVVRLLELAWPRLDEAQRAKWRLEIDELLDWTLTRTLDEEGRFRPVLGFDSSIADSFYYGVSFLTRVGFCGTAPPFWTDARWPDAAPLCCRIAARLEDLGRGLHSADSARERLARAGLSCEVDRG